MKKFRFLFVLGALVTMTVSALAGNEYLKKEKHYLAYSAGQDKVHFKIPVYACDTYNHWSNGDSYVFYVHNGVQHRIAWYKSDSYDLNETTSNGKGTAYLKISSGEGIIVVTSMADGVKKKITTYDAWTEKLVVQQREDDGYTVTFLEFDWYMPEKLNEQPFSVGIHFDEHRSYTTGGKYGSSGTFTWPDFMGQQQMMTPMLYDPYLYLVNDNGVTGYGYAGIPYSVFYEPINYSTSLNPDKVATTERSGNLFVMTNDTVQEQFYADIEVYRNKAADEKVVQRTIPIDIPPYHHIYDFAVTEETDSTGTFTGNNILQWSVKNPWLTDIIDGDYFEVQRAMKSDFSDAKQLGVVQMKRDSSGLYSLPDNSRETWSGNAELRTDTIATILKHTVQNYIVKDNNGEPFYDIDFTLQCDEGMTLPSVPVYYRVRRASSAVWGWEHDYMQSFEMNKHSYLAPLAVEQEPYTLDADYENNRQVNFRLKLDNADVTYILPPKEKFNLVTNKVNYCLGDSCNIHIEYVEAQYPTEFTLRRENGDIIVRKLIAETQDVKCPVGGSISFSYTTLISRPRATPLITTRTLNYEITTDCMFSYRTSWVSNGFTSVKVVSDILRKDDYERINAKLSDCMSVTGQKEHLIDSLYSLIQAEYENANLGKCMWDKTARLVLVRTIEETGQTTEFVIPQDSIKRQPDGSWIASFSDNADKACTHYKYAVRIDPTHCDLRLQKPEEQLKPVEITGPSLYFDEGAKIASFIATQGDARSEMKRGVLLNWKPSNQSVDEYVLQRKIKDSDEADTTLYTGLETSYFDKDAAPDTHYEYTVTAYYSCNGKNTNNYASTEGWRTKYGEIRGSVILSDNSGMNSVKVDLQGSDGTVLRTITTDASGGFVFDSLEYNFTTGTNYAVVPTHKYGVFSFNHTTAGSAGIKLEAKNAVVSGLDFENTSSVRLSGRVLYKNSTIPVAGAMFLLNGDTVIRNTVPLLTALDGTFELVVPKNQPCKLQVIKTGHEFEGDGILRVEGDEEVFAISKALDGVRFYDVTTVRLVGRVAGGNDQRDLPRAFGLGYNNLGDDLQLVLQLEGDNTAHFVHDPNDLTRDTIQQKVDHIVYSNNTADNRVVGSTNTLFEKKRVTIHPDIETGEFQVDLFPVKYKVIQATAKGYATLFPAGTGSDVFDLTNAPLQTYTATYTKESNTITVVENNGTTIEQEAPESNGLYNGESVTYNAVYDRIYHNPVEVALTQMIYGMEQPAYGEPKMDVSGLTKSQCGEVALYNKLSDGTIEYLMDYPVFYSNRRYQFAAQAYEDYYYNNDTQAGKRDRVPQRGGSVTVHNGLHDSKTSETFVLDVNGRNSSVWLTVDHVDTDNAGLAALRTVSVALNVEGNVVETDVFRGFVVGDTYQATDLHSTLADIQLLDIVRDPGGAGSSAWVESGTTYNFSYKENYNWEAGFKLTLKYGLNVSSDIGVITAPEGAGSYTGSTFTTSKQFSFPIPIVHSWSWGYQHSYSFTTTEKITTASSKNKLGVGANADIFMGVTLSQLSGKAKSVAIIGDSLYQMRQPAIEAGTMKVLAQGVDSAGNPYYLVTGQKVILGSAVSNTFVYSQDYILGTLMPKLALERQDLLMNFNSEEEAQALADEIQEPVYWYKEKGTVSLTDTLKKSSYQMIVPQNDRTYNDKVAALDNMLLKWTSLIYQNEKEKVMARTMGQKVGTYSVSYGNTFTHNDTYSATSNYNEMPQGWDLLEYEGEKALVSLGEGMINNLGSIADFWGTRNDSQFGKSAASALKTFYKSVLETGGPDENGVVEFESHEEKKNATELGTVTNNSKFSFDFDPVLEFDSDDRTNQDKTVKKNCGFTIVSDQHGDITVSVYRANLDSVWQKTTDVIRDNIPLDIADDMQYGSYVFFTEAGTTYCPHQDEQKTVFYNKGTLLSNGTSWVTKPEISANTYEITNVAPDKRAVFRLELQDNGQVGVGRANDGRLFNLMLDATSNPNGAKLYVDGVPLLNGAQIFMYAGQMVTKTLEVERGTVDDYENLGLLLSVDDCAKTYSTIKLSVHFLPVSTDVEISSPRQNWIMNTLSAQDSAGYYLPITIDGFDIHHKNFDHIEFQYKLSTQSEDDWVNQCSFYADDSLYNLATGSKAMIENGRIAPFRFYGERDPMEQNYDLRAVSFCRYGSGFVTKASPVISGTKDTRPPRVFGEPEPVNSILGVGDNLLLRFNEPIAGNWLDEDNNFQIIGVTNETGIRTSTTLHFDEASVAETKIERNISNKSLTVDMMIRPKSDGTLFLFKNAERPLKLSLENNKLVLNIDGKIITSQSFDKILEFTRVILVYDNDSKQVRFYMGTEDITDPNAEKLDSSFAYVGQGILSFGGFTGDMMETRVWVKALTPEEIAATHMHYLTGYEMELAAYYRMNEGKGEAVSDRASGAALYLDNCAWNKQSGWSLALNGEPAALNGNLLARSKAYDATYMFWFRTKDDQNANGTVFTAGRTDSKHGTEVSFQNGVLNLYSDSLSWKIGTSYGDGEWHHFVLVVNRTFNNVSVFVDGKMTNSFSAQKLAGIQGSMFLGGNSFKGNIDEFAVFEQALPKTLIETYDNLSLAGDEMGLVGYLPFEEQVLNPNGILEQVFSGNDQRVIKDANGNQVEKSLTLLTVDGDGFADKVQNAPVSDYGLLSKLKFDWSFNGDELMINILNKDYEVNKQTIYITVRDVEDLNGNPMLSPVTWTAFVDRNSLKWELQWDKGMLDMMTYYNDEVLRQYDYEDVYIVNNSGKRHQYTIESLPYWLTTENATGSIDPMETKTIRFWYDQELAVGVYTDIIYLTDENGLSEPLPVQLRVQTTCPWGKESDLLTEISKYPNTMSIRSQIRIENESGTSYFDTDNEDVIAIFCNGNWVGMAYNKYDNASATSYAYLTVYGNNKMEGQPLTFKLWRNLTGKIYVLEPNKPLVYSNNAMNGFAPEQPITLSATAHESQQIELSEGWNWVSWYIKPNDENIKSMFTKEQGFYSSDQIKSPAEQKFSEFVDNDDESYWVGTLSKTDCHNMYMFYVSRPYLKIDIEGSPLSEAERAVTLHNDWNSIAYMLDEPVTVREALADYIDKAEVGDVIKSKNAVAVFSENGRWEGSLQNMFPGQGYLFKRNGQETVTMHYYKPISRLKSAEVAEDVIAYSNPRASSNMTLVAKVDGQSVSDGQRLLAYVGSELAGVSQQQEIDGDTLYFVTISPANTLDKNTEVTFKLENKGEILGTTQPMFNYVANDHRGTPGNPVLLDFGADNSSRYYPADVRFYTVAGKFVGELKNAESEQQVRQYLNLLPYASGTYNAVLNSNGEIINLKMIKK